jgi:putative ABC transport system substrate-binding protein
MATEGRMSICLRRRELIAGLGASAVARPLAVRAQQRAMPVIGFLGGSTAAAQSQWTSAFVQRLRELGWTEGRNVAIEYRWGEGRNERYAEIAAEFVRLKVDVIVTAGSAALTLKQATSAIPIVFAGAQDPLGGGLVASLARPGGNLTGLSAQLADIAGKRAELLREAVPGLHRLAIMANVSNSLAVLEMGEAQTDASPHWRPSLVGRDGSCRGAARLAVGLRTVSRRSPQSMTSNRRGVIFSSATHRRDFLGTRLP